MIDTLLLVYTSITGITIIIGLVVMVSALVEIEGKNEESKSYDWLVVNTSDIIV
jgi:hypothetical protein